jgi:hypothetical protein
MASVRHTVFNARSRQPWFKWLHIYKARVFHINQPVLLEANCMYTRNCRYSIHNQRCMCRANNAIEVRKPRQANSKYSHNDWSHSQVILAHQATQLAACAILDLAMYCSNCHVEQTRAGSGQMKSDSGQASPVCQSATRKDSLPTRQHYTQFMGATGSKVSLPDTREPVARFERRASRCRLRRRDTRNE